MYFYIDIYAHTYICYIYIDIHLFKYRSLCV